MKFNKLIPELYVSDISKSLDFYKSLGFEIRYDRPQSKFAFIEMEGSQIMLCEINGTWEVGELSRPFGRGINLQMEVENVDELYRKVVTAKYPLFEEVADKTEYGNREFLIQDPDGYLLRFYTELNKIHKNTGEY